MEKCKQIWNWDPDSMTDLEFDAFLDHALLCEVHERVLDKYERSTEPIIRAALEYNFASLRNISGFEENAIVANWSISQSVSEDINLASRIKSYLRFFAPLTNNPIAVTTFLLLLGSFLTFRIANIRDSVPPDPVRASGSRDASSVGNVATPALTVGAFVPPGVSDSSIGDVRSNGNDVRGIGGHAETGRSDPKVSNSANPVNALLEAVRKLSKSIMGFGAGCGNEYYEKLANSDIPADKSDKTDIEIQPEDEKQAMKPSATAANANVASDKPDEPENKIRLGRRIQLPVDLCTSLNYEIDSAGNCIAVNSDENSGT